VARRVRGLSSEPHADGGPPEQPPPAAAGEGRLRRAPHEGLIENGPDRSPATRLEVANRSLASQNALLKQLVAIYDRMAGMVLQGADIGAITDLLAELIDRPVRVFDPVLQPLASATPGSVTDDSAAAAAERLRWTPGEPQLARVLANLVEGRRPLRIPPMPGWGTESGMVIAPIVAGADILGYLTIFDTAGPADATNLDLLVVQHAATVYALTLTRERLSADVANRLKEDLLEGLLLGQTAGDRETEHRALLLGYDPRRSYRLLVVSVEDIATFAGAAGGETPAALALRRRVLETIVEQVGRTAREAVAVARKDEVVILLPEAQEAEATRRSEAAVELGEAIADRLRHPFPVIALTTGISGLCQEVTELARCYAQARRTLAAARQFGRTGKVTSFEELGIYRLLFQVPDAAELRRFADQVLGSLIAYDRRHEADLVRTLGAYLRHHGSLQSAARELVVHVNTVSYRLQRIQEIAVLDLDDAEDRLTAQVALKILEGLEAG
jgi:purine catabolism regulator